MFPHLLLAFGCAAPAAQEPPRLLVLISVDQLIPEQLDRLAPLLDGGLGRLWREGTVFRDAALGHAATETGPGHATLATGCDPARHGVTGNTFYDHGRGRAVYCVGDDDARPVPAGASGGRVSPRNLRVPTLADHLRARYPEARVVSVAGKDRSAVCMAGRTPDAALWWDRSGAGFMSSSAYGAALPGFAQAWNTGWVAQAAGWSWTPSFEGDPTRLGTEADDRPGEAPFPGHGTTFPYTLPALGDDPAASARALAPVVFQCPLVDLFTLEVAAAAVRDLGLGADGTPDLIAVGLSGCDVVGHAFGPYSWEVTDLLLRVDDALGRLFDQLDGRLGAGRWICALSADHGVLELPESLAARGVGARRATSAERGALLRAVSEALKARWPADTPRVTPWGRGFLVPRDAGIEPAELRRVVAEAAGGVAHVAAAYTHEDLAAAPAPGDDGFLALYRAGFDPERTEDVLLRNQPWLLAGMARGTSHGSPYPYDRRVPLVFYGPGFRAERRHDPASSADAAPTLLGRIGIEPAGCDGRDLGDG